MRFGSIDYILENCNEYQNISSSLKSLLYDNNFDFQEYFYINAAHFKKQDGKKTELFFPKGIGDLKGSYHFKVPNKKAEEIEQVFQKLSDLNGPQERTKILKRYAVGWTSGFIMWGLGLLVVPFLALPGALLELSACAYNLGQPKYNKYKTKKSLFNTKKDSALFIQHESPQNFDKYVIKKVLGYEK